MLHTNVRDLANYRFHDRCCDKFFSSTRGKLYLPSRVFVRIEGKYICKVP